VIETAETGGHWTGNQEIPGREEEIRKFKLWAETVAQEIPAVELEQMEFVSSVPEEEGLRVHSFMTGRTWLGMKIIMCMSIETEVTDYATGWSGQEPDIL
jgi:hypothetical protein